MTTTLQNKPQHQAQNNPKTIDGKELVSALSSSHLLPQIIKEIIIEKAIADIPYTQDELKLFTQKYLQPNNNPTNIESIAIRQLKIHKFKEAHWGSQVEPHFLSKKHLLDQVSFSLIQSNSAEIIQEIYFRIKEGEASFEELARQYSQNAEAKNGGWVGKFKLCNIEPAIANALINLQPGEISRLLALQKTFIIVRLERIYPAQLNEQMRMDILQGMFEEWLKLEIANYGDYIDLSTVAKSDFIVNKSQPITHTNQITEDADPDLESHVNELPATPIEGNNITPVVSKWKSLQLATVSFLCLVTGGWGGFQLSNSLNSSSVLSAENTKNDPFYDAITQATKAANLTQTAQTPREWQQVSQFWINAIALLKSIPENHPQFTLATQKVKEYESNLNYSRKNSENRQNSFRLAVNHAINAANLTQTASSSQEWETVIKHWQNAISLMKAVKPNHPHYFMAQEKTLE
jgi:hypothetical protein